MFEGTELDVNSAVDRFYALVGEGIESIKKAAKIYVDCIDKFPESRGLFAERRREYGTMTWSMIESIGRGSMNPRFLVDRSAGYARLRCCQRSEQDYYVENPAEVVVAGGDVMKIMVSEMTRDQLRQVFAHDHVRSLPEQRAWLEQERAAERAIAERAEMKVGVKYRISGGNLHVHDGAVFSREELCGIIARLK